MKKNKLCQILLITIFIFSKVTPTLAANNQTVSYFYASFWSLIPSAAAITLALITKEVFSSLFIGIFIGALFQCNFNLIATLDVIIKNGFITAITNYSGIFLFLILLGNIVCLINSSGGSEAFGRWAQKNICTRISAMLVTFILGVLIFIDDYFNCLTVGSVMLPITDRNKVSRAKLSYLIDATAAPICMIAPVSSWAAAVSATAENLNTGISGIQLFIKTIAYNFYSLLTFVFVIGLCVMDFDYGPMKIQEKEAQKNIDTFIEEKSKKNSKGCVLDLILPVVALIFFCIIGIIYVGGFWENNNGDFISAFSNTDAFVALPWGALITLILTIIYMLSRRLINFKEAMACLPQGFTSMVSPIIILTLAVSLNTMTNSLGADVFVHNIMTNVSGNLYNFLPSVIFVAACLLAFASGTSWGTFGILIPIVTTIFTPGSTLLIIGISACLAGAVCGDHCSPISDTTIMASAGAQCDHVTHVSTQLPYVITVAIISFITFIIAGFVQNSIICLSIGILLTLGVLFAIKKFTNK